MDDAIAIVRSLNLSCLRLPGLFSFFYRESLRRIREIFANGDIVHDDREIRQKS